jgi:plastocyanin
MRTRLQRAALLLAPLLLPVVANAATHTVKIEGMQFQPATITAKAGDRIVWRNADLVPHTVTARGRFDSGAIAPGRSWEHQVPATPGRYDYICTFHPGMKATLVVQ